MSTVTEQPKTDKPLVKYSPADAEIAVMKDKYLPLTADTPKGYELVRQALAEVRSYRTAVEKRRVELKADALEWGRKVDSEAKRITGLLLEVEEPLKAKKQAVDDEKVRVAAEKAAAVEAEQRRKIEEERAEAEAKLKAARDAEEARIKEEAAKVAAERAALEAERKRIDAEQAEKRKAEEAHAAEERRKVEAEQAAERKRLADERANLEAEQKAERERQEAARKKMEEDRAAVERERQRLEREEFERQAKIKAEQAAREKAERDRIAAEEARVAALEYKAAEEKRLAALRPDVEKVRKFGTELTAWVFGNWPEVKSKEAKTFLGAIKPAFDDLANRLREYQTELVGSR